MIILGIDPGLATTGFGIIQGPKLSKPKNRQPQAKKLTLVNLGCIITDPRCPTNERLEKIHKDLKKIIKKYNPSKIAIEKLFFAKNVKTAMKVGEARGVILLTAQEMRIPIFEFSPLQVKLAITGYGRASKNQMQKMIKILLELKEIPKSDDAVDALAIAITCVQSINAEFRSKM